MLWRTSLSGSRVAELIGHTIPSVVMQANLNPSVGIKLIC